MGNYIDKLNDQDGNVIYPITLTKAVYKEDTSSTLDDLLTAKLDTSAYTASDALAKIKTVDGAGSGLDADLLDGKEASAFSLNDHVHTLSNISGVTATAAELNYVDGVTSNIQSQLDSKYSSDNLPLYPVTSVNGKQGIVVLSASDVSAISIDDITTVLGSSTSKVPSEKAVADAISNSGGGDMSKVNYATQSDSIVDQSFKAEKDGDGNIITSTYSKNKIEINVDQPSGQNINDFWYKIL